MSSASPEPTVAAEVVAVLGGRSLTLATAESVTGGGLGAVVTAVPGASAVYAGGVVSYATRVKQELLGVPAELVARHGVVSAACAEAMAEVVRRVVGADLGVSTTGVAGPEPQEGKAVGLVYVAVADGTSTVSRELRLAGDREAIRAATSHGALRLLLERLGS
jgi:PncC family amidohydrolase